MWLSCSREEVKHVKSLLMDRRTGRQTNRQTDNRQLGSDEQNLTPFNLKLTDQNLMVLPITKCCWTRLQGN